MTACLQTQCNFGKMTVSNKNIGGYRYSFQGQEKEPETGKEAFQLRLWDGRIGRWLTIDPYGQYSSPYVGMGNDPINGIDPDGGCDDGKGNLIPCPEDGSGKYHQLDGISLTVKEGGYLIPKGLDWNQTNWQQVYKLDIDRIKARIYSYTDASAKVMAGIMAAPITIEAALIGAPLLISEFGLIASSTNIIRSTIASGFTLNTTTQFALKFTASSASQFFTNGLSVGEIDFFDASLGALYGGIGSLTSQSFFDYKFNSGFTVNKTNAIILNLTGKVLIKNLHSRITIPRNTVLGDRPLFDVGDMFSKMIISTSYKSAIK